MKKITNFLSSIGLLLLGLFLFASNAYADIAPFPGGGGRFSPNNNNGTVILVAAGVGVGVVALVSWLVIRAIRRKKNVVNK